MGSAIGLREDFDGAALRRLSRTTKNTNQARRLLALAEIYDGGSRSAAARIGGVGRDLPPGSPSIITRVQRLNTMARTMSGAGHCCNHNARWPVFGGHRLGCRTFLVEKLIAQRAVEGLDEPVLLRLGRVDVVPFDLILARPFQDRPTGKFGAIAHWEAPFREPLGPDEDKVA